MGRIQRMVMIAAVLLPIGMYAAEIIRGQVFLDRGSRPLGFRCPDCDSDVTVSRDGREHCYFCDRVLFGPPVDPDK